MQGHCKEPLQHVHSQPGSCDSGQAAGELSHVISSVAALCRYTHVLKTDDDCYIRYRALVATLQQPAVGSRRKPPPQMTSVYKGERAQLLWARVLDGIS